MRQKLKHKVSLACRRCLRSNSDVLLQSVAIFVDVEGSVLSRHPLLVFLYSSIVSAIGNVVNFMVGTSEFVGIEPAQGACQQDKPVRYLLQGGTGKFGKHLHVEVF